jgi:hypothetical protein
MLQETTLLGEKIEVLSDGSLQVRDATVITRDGVIDASFPAKYHRYVLHPGEDLTGKPERLAAVANSVWTEEVVAAWIERSDPR